MFPVTRLSLIERIQKGGEEGRKALGEWFVAYRPPMRKFVTIRFRGLAHEADEIVDAFTTKIVLENLLIDRYVPHPGRRFRGYLVSALYNYCVGLLRSQQRRTRRSGGPVLSFDETMDKPDQEAMDVHDILWARQVLGQALRRTKRHCELNKRCLKGHVWAVLEARFLRPFLRGKPEIPYSDLVTRCGFGSPSHATKSATEGKRLLSRMMLAVASEYAGGRDAESEIEDLWRIVRRIRDIRRQPQKPPEADDQNKE